jgi:hypothetical protein
MEALTVEREPAAAVATAPLFTMRAELGQRRDAGPGPNGRRSYNAVTRGRFEGPRMRGEILPGSADWMLVRPDGTMIMDARAVLLTDDGAVIHMSYGGRIIIPPALTDKVRDPDERERVDPASYYLRTLPTFETGDGKYGWLNNIVCVGKGFLLTDGVGYDVFQVL